MDDKKLEDIYLSGGNPEYDAREALIKTLFI